MADQFAYRADEWMRRIFVLEDSGNPKHPVKGRIDYGAKEDVEKEIAAALRSIDTEAESRGFARGVNAAANLCVYRHRDGSVCLDRDNCTVDVVHQYYEPKGLERLIRALIPKEPKTDPRTDVEIEERMDELFASD